MKSEGKLISAGLLASIAASLCCVTPVLAIIVGTSGVASTFSWLEPFRPYLIAVTLLVLGYAWFQKVSFRKRTDEYDCETNTKPKFIQSMLFLGIITFMSIVMLSFPMYSHLFYGDLEKRHVVVDESKAQSISINIEGMTCESCAKHIDHEINNLNGIVNSTISYESGNALVLFDINQTTVRDIENAINSTEYIVTVVNEN